MATAILDTSRIVDWDTFHAVSQEAFGFPDFYGCNLNAWIDCLTYLDDGGDGMSRFKLADGEVLTIEVRGADDFTRRLPEQALALVSITAAVNERYIERGKPPVLVLISV
jgi:hypothetical protein